MQKHVAAHIFAIAAASAISLAPSGAGATTYSGKGWVQLQKEASASASTTKEGYDFSVGYAAFFGLEGYNWDAANNLISVSCVSYEVDLGLFTSTIVESECAALPGSILSSSTASASTTFGVLPATRKTKTIVYDVPDIGAMARVDGYFSVPVTLFDEDVDLFKLTGTGIGNTHGADEVSASVYVLGAKIASASATLPASARVAEQCVTLFEAEGSFSVMGIPIEVSASSEGCIYVDASASWGNKTLAGTLTPGASIDATLKAGVGVGNDVIGAGAGVYGNLTIVDASVPVTLSAAIGPGGVTVTESAKLTMTGLDGEVGVYGEICFIGCIEEELEIFDWTGLTYAEATIFSETQTVN